MDPEVASNGSLFLDSPRRFDSVGFGLELENLEPCQLSQSHVAASGAVSHLMELVDKALLEKDFLERVPSITTNILLQHVDAIIPFGLSDQPQHCADDSEVAQEPALIPIDTWAALRLPLISQHKRNRVLSPPSKLSSELLSPKEGSAARKSSPNQKQRESAIHLESIDELPKEGQLADSVSFQVLPISQAARATKSRLSIGGVSAQNISVHSPVSPINRSHDSMGAWIRSARKFITAMDAPDMPDLIPLKEFHSRPGTTEQKLRIMKEQQVIREKNLQKEEKLRQELMDQNKANFKKHLKQLTYDFEGKSLEVNPLKPPGKSEAMVQLLMTQINNYDPNEVRVSKKQPTKMNLKTSGELTALTSNNSANSKGKKKYNLPSQLSFQKLEFPPPQTKRPVVEELDSAQRDAIAANMILQSKAIPDPTRLNIGKQNPFDVMAPTPGVVARLGNREKNGGMNNSEHALKDPAKKMPPGNFADLRFSRFEYEYLREKRVQDNRNIYDDEQLPLELKEEDLPNGQGALAKQKSVLNNPVLKGIKEGNESPADGQHQKVPKVAKVAVKNTKLLAELMGNQRSEFNTGKSYSDLIKQRAEQFRAQLSQKSLEPINPESKTKPDNNFPPWYSRLMANDQSGETIGISSKPVAKNSAGLSATRKGVDLSESAQGPGVALPGVKPPSRRHHVHSHSSKALKSFLSPQPVSYQTPSVSKSLGTSKLEDLLSQSDHLVSRFGDSQTTASRPRDRVYHKAPRHLDSGSSKAYLAEGIFFKPVKRPR